MFCPLERALSQRSSSTNSFLGGPRRVSCQLDFSAYSRRVILHKVFVEAHLDAQQVTLLPTRLSRSRGEKPPSSQFAGSV